jgi:hypothetical protein
MLPKNLRYGNKVESAAAKSYRTNIQPQNGTGTYQMGDTITLNIPTRANLVLATTESYLKFTVAYTNGTAAQSIRLDSCGAHGLIQRIRIWHGSNLLQDIDNYGLLAKMLFDVQVSTDSIYGKMNVISGTRNDLVLTLPTAAAAGTAGVANAGQIDTAIATALAPLSAANVSALQVNSGELIGTGIANGIVNSVTYSLNLISLIGTLCSQQYFPLFACTSAPLRAEIILVDQPYKAYVGSDALAGSFAISNCEYVANFIELSDVAMGMIQQSLQGSPLQFVVPDYRNFGGSYATTNGTASQYSFPIPAKFSSLKSLFVTNRDKGTGTVRFFPYSCVTNYISDYYFRVGSQIMPSKAPSTIQEQFCELLKAVGSISDLNHQPSIEKASYSQSATAQFTTANHLTNSSGSFYIGLDLENYANSSKDSIFAGYNSNTDDIFAVLNYGQNVATTTNRLDAFALFDCVVVLENNTAYVRY